MRSKKNAQVNVGIPRDSEMYRFYQEEARRQGVRLPTFIYQLLLDRYDALAGLGQGVWFPRGYDAPQRVVKPLEPRPPSPRTPRTVFQAFGGEDEDDEDMGETVPRIPAIR